MPARGDDGSEALGGWRQGDIVLGTAVVQNTGWVDPLHLVDEEVHGFVVVTQTCDLVRSPAARPYVQMAPIVEVERDEVVTIERGYRPAYAALAGLSEEGLVVDLDRIVTVHKRRLAALSRLPGPKDDDEARRFAQALARKLARFAFPDDFVTRMRGLQSRLTKKHAKNSPEGIALRSLREIRVSAQPDWGAEQVALFIWFVARGGLHDGATPVIEPWVDRWLKRFEAGGRFIDVDGKAVVLDEMTAREYVESVRLDLDHLSRGES